MAGELPENNLVLQALHAIRNAVVDLKASTETGFARLDARIDETNRRLDETNERLESLRIFTVQKLTDLNSKVDETNHRLDETNRRLGRLEDEHHQLNERFEHFLTGEGAQLVKRVAKLEAELEVVKGKLAN